jgi:hypothetical protein
LTPAIRSLGNAGAVTRLYCAVTALCAVVLLAGCDYLPFGYTPIREILAAPGQFEGKEVKVKGKASGASKLPLIDIKSYRVTDDGGEVVVITQGALPKDGDAVSLTGIVKSTAIIGGQSLGLRIEETKRR